MKKFLMASVVITLINLPLTSNAVELNTTEQQNPLPAPPPSPLDHIQASQQANEAQKLKQAKPEDIQTTFNYGQYGNYQPLPDYLKDHPAILLKNAVERVSQFVSTGGVSDIKSLDRFLEEQIAPFFNFQEMASIVGGRLYKKMDDTNQKEFQQRLQILMFDTLTAQLTSFDGSMPRIGFFPPITNKKQMIARMRVFRGNMQPTNLAFRFMEGDDGWKVVDVAANGHSAILYYRQYYRSYVQELNMRQRMTQQEPTGNSKEDSKPDNPKTTETHQ